MIFFCKGENMKKIVTSESVNKGHPDKTCDIIADAFLDKALSQDPNAQMAVECAIKDDLLMIYGEATTSAQIDYEAIAQQVLLQEIGYEKPFRFVKQISTQSPDIHAAVVQKTLMANDQGMMYGYATSETQEFLPLSVVVAHKLMKQYEQFRLEHNKQYFADAKSQVSVQYDNDKIEKIATVLVSVSHADFVEHSQIEQQIKQNVIDVVLAQYSQYVQDDLQIIINPSGKFTVWGSYSDSGCVGRKIVVDTYGGIGRVGGGCFSSKNATKVDRSGAYFARYVAKNIVANNFASKCEVALSFAIGQEKPLNLNIDCFGTNTLPMEQIYKIVENNFNFDLSSIIKTLDLLKPIYKQTACYGHFGNNAYPWEKVITLQIQ